MSAITEKITAAGAFRPQIEDQRLGIGMRSTDGSRARISALQRWESEGGALPAASLSQMSGVVN